VPRWFFLLSAFSLIFYQTLDNMDGKQARRTGSSSPLGQIFDHGCDATNAFFSGVNFGVTACCGTDSPRLLALIFLLPTIPFYVATWEEWHTGCMLLPGPINGPSEGLLMMVGFNLATWWWGPEWWGWVVPGSGDLLGAALGPAFSGGLTSSDTMLVVSSGLGAVTVLAQVAGVPLHYYRKGSRGADVLAPLAGLLPLAWVCGFGGLWMGASRGLLHDRPRAFAALLMTLFVEAVVCLIFTHVTHSRFQVVRTLSLPLPVCWLLAARGGFTRLQQEILLVAYLYIALAYVASLLVYIVRECCDTLGVQCFRITPKANL